MRRYKPYFYAHLLIEYAKEEEKEKNKMTYWPTFHRVLLRKSDEYLLIILHNQIIVSGFSNVRSF